MGSLAKKQQLERLLAGTADWNSWRTERPDIEVDLAGCDLRGADLSGADLREANLVRADLTGASLRRALLMYADLTKAKLSDTDLTYANLSSAQLIEAILTGAQMVQAYLERTDLTRADLRLADLSGTNLFDTHLLDANLSGAILPPTEMYRLQIRLATNASLEVIAGFVRALNTLHRELTGNEFTNPVMRIGKPRRSAGATGGIEGVKPSIISVLGLGPAVRAIYEGLCAWEERKAAEAPPPTVQVQLTGSIAEQVHERVLAARVDKTTRFLRSARDLAAVPPTQEPSEDRVAEAIDVLSRLVNNGTIQRLCVTDDQ